MGAILLRMFAISYSERTVLAVTLERGFVSGWSGPWLKRKRRPCCSSESLRLCSCARACGATELIKRQNTTNREKTRVDRFILFVLRLRRNSGTQPLAPEVLVWVVALD